MRARLHLALDEVIGSEFQPQHQGTKRKALDREGAERYRECGK
jgi:hypothetical protein